MLARLQKLFAAPETEAAPAAAVADHEFAAAALMVEAAALDGSFAPAERERIAELLVHGFHFAADEAQALIEEAQKAHDDSSQIVRWTTSLKDALDERERELLIECLWEVAYADGVVHDYEDNLIRRVAGLIYVSDRARGAARIRVARRRGLD